MQSRKILILKTDKNGSYLETVTVDTDSLPNQLNGEIGNHIFHVCVLTSLILTEYLASNPSSALTEQDIEEISTASAMHDIGKMQIPESILDFPGRLSPVQYDIIKKHSVFGEKIINDAKAAESINPKTVAYAKQIARYHHERYDGSGYPDGLIGDEIPIAAQAVSLADAYDALTSPRSYKPAFSQDVATQMISNGLCGVFNEKLVNALLKVVNDNEIVKIREKLNLSGNVVAAEGEYVPKKVLITGNIAYVTQQFIDTLFPESKIILIGNTSLKTNKRLKVLPPRPHTLKSILTAHDINVIIYFSQELNYEGELVDDTEQLRRLLKYTKKTQTDAKTIYFSSLDCAFLKKNDCSILCGAKEDICNFYAESEKMDIRVVRIPYLYSSVAKNSFLDKIFSQLEKDRNISIEQNATDTMHFMSMHDLASLTSRLIENWSQGGGTLTVGDEFGLTFADFAQELASIDENASITFEGQSTQREIKTSNKSLRNRYAWFSKFSIVDELRSEYEQYFSMYTTSSEGFWARIKEWIDRHPRVVKGTETALLFVLTELLLRVTGSELISSIVDFRMAYVVIISTVHGIGFGLCASALSSLSWFFAKISAGTSWLTIFYEPTNWLAFVFYFLIGAICGFIHLRSENRVKSVEEEMQIIEEKLAFTRDIYNDTHSEKKELKKQIISSKDSFGKIFDITRKLDTVETRILYLKIIETFEDILENKSIAVYSIAEGGAFGRLEVASRNIVGSVTRSISMQTYDPVIRSFNGGEIWRNTELLPDMPMYAAGVYRDEKLTLAIFLWQADMEQYSLYYVNLFKILRDLAQMSLLRAYDYNNAVREKQYISNTKIMNSDAFEACLRSFDSLLERKIFSYVLLDVNCGERDFEECAELLSSRVRVNDVIGVSSNRHFLILLSQASEEDLQYILPRFDGLDLEIKVLRK